MLGRATVELSGACEIVGDRGDLVYALRGKLLSLGHKSVAAGRVRGVAIGEG